MQSKLFLPVLCCAFLLTSCATIGVSPETGVYNPDHLPESKLATLIVSKGLRVSAIDDTSLSLIPGGWFTNEHMLRVAPGTRIFTVSFDSGTSAVMKTKTVIASLGEGQVYVMEGMFEDGDMRISVREAAGREIAALGVRPRPQTDAVSL